MNNIKIERMNLSHIDAVQEIEEEAFAVPWSRKEFENEIARNKCAVYFVALTDENDIVGYCGMWHVITEGHITNIAVRKAYQKRGIGSALLESLINYAEENKIFGITLEVKISNYNAQRLYTKYGFKPEGFRKNYYTDTNEDAVIMWKYFEK